MSFASSSSSKAGFLSRLDRIVGVGAGAATAAAGLATFTTTDVAEGAIVQVTPGVPIAIPNDIDGIYMNVVTGAFAAAPPVGWDINPYTALAGQFNLWGATANTWFNPQGVIGGNYNLPFGTVISGASTAFFRPGGGTNVGLNMTLNSNQNYLGFRFTNEANANLVHFGWAQLQFGATAGERSIVKYAYESVAETPIAAGVPEPTTLALLAMGAMGLISRRRRA